VNCKLMPTYYEISNTIDGVTRGKSSDEKVEKVLVLYLLKQLQHDRWLVSGDAELESKSIGFKVYIPVHSVENSSSSVIVGTLVQIDDDGSLEMVFHSEDSNGCIVSTETDIKKSLQSAASMPLPPYIEPENAIKVRNYATPK
jgi:S-adenosylmethionine:tRNA-ribosyltransferase-isomerase (queuine synthetase)